MLKFYPQKLTHILTNDEKKSLLKISILKTIENLLEIIGLGIILPIIMIIQDQKKFLILYFPNITFEPWIINNLIYFVLLSFLIIFVTKIIYGFYIIKYQYSIVSNIKERLTHNTFTKLVSNNEAVNISSVSATNSIINDCSGIVNLIINPTIVLISEFTFLFGSILSMLYINPKSTLIIILMSITISCVYFLINKFISRDLGSEARSSDQLMHHYINEIFSGLLEFRIYNSFYKKIDQFNKSLISNNTIHIKQNILNYIPRVTLEFLIILFFCIITIILVINEIDLSELLPIITFYVAIMFRLLPTFNKINHAYNSYKFGESALTSISNILSQHSNKIRSYCKFNQHIELYNISYKYSKKYIFTNLFLKIEKFDCIGITGKSGTGKTTLVNLLSGLIKPTEGFIFIDNKKLIFDESMLEVGYVPQHVNILDGTLIENIIYDRNLPPEVDLHELIVKVLKLASLTDFIDETGKILNIDCGHSGSKISGGQRQRIGIARALLLEPSFLIFDESTASLDIENENNILRTISSLIGSYTIIIISHKSHTLNFCNKLFKLDSSLIPIRHS